LFVDRSLSVLRDAKPLPADNRAAALARAGDAFGSGTIGGLGPEDYHVAVSRLSGLPIATVRMASQAITASAHGAYQAALMGMPVGAVADWRDPRTRSGSAVWTRRADLLSILAAGNHPAVHALWLQAVALGFKVAVRPSQREPLTPHRLIAALLESGFRDDRLLPCGHEAADRLVDGADLSVVYGSDAVIRKYKTRSNVLPQGPGRSKLLLTQEADWPGCLDAALRSVCGEGGTACLNATAVYVEGDPAPVAAAIAERLAELPSLPPENEKAVLPVQAAAAASAIEKYLLDRSGDAKAWLGGDGVADDLGDGSAVLRPAVFQVSSPEAPQTGIELPFPCLWVAPWSLSDGVRPLRNTLVLTVFTHNEQLIGRLIDEPTISNVYVGNQPTVQPGPGMPHDSYFSDFLMRAKSVIRT
jgi:acyl-CoA reductase-like NAD-dependent aldehyde dehydrogenase